MPPKQKSSSKKKGTKRNPPRRSEIVVRMYRGLLGDCFLLRFPRARGKDAFILIDCGVFSGMPDEKQTMQAIAADIKQTVRGVLDVVVVTHEHWDHLSGFSHAKEVFDGLTINQLWLAWTENDADELARRLRDQRNHAREQLGVMMKSKGEREELKPIREVMEFFGELGASEMLSPTAGEKPSGTAQIIDSLKKHATSTRYLLPSEAFCVADVPEPGARVNVYVLGPPRDETLLKRSDRTKGGKEVYQLAVNTYEDYFLARHRLKNLGERGESNPDEKDSFNLSLPFDRRHIIPTRKLNANQDGQGSVVPEPTPEPSERLKELYEIYDATKDWQGIDNGWIGAAEQLALKLDSDTNNTSLVLAFEIGKAGKVLLFPGDAQVENWLSWHDCRWPKDAKDGDSNLVTAKQLLERTVLYKVGHHASHNATLREQGLELMTSPELVAMIPVNEEFARDKKHWDMPFQPLLDRLKERTRGRVLRADRSANETVKECKSPDLNAFDKRATDGPDGLYLEYTIPIE